MAVDTLERLYTIRLFRRFSPEVSSSGIGPDCSKNVMPDSASLYVATVPTLVHWRVARGAMHSARTACGVTATSG